MLMADSATGEDSSWLTGCVFSVSCLGDGESWGLRVLIPFLRPPPS